ncbi:MAG: type II secretion system protein GspE [Deltaproteobacteria bacterium SM23_61]|nr:MAG: type II secretion system protein GspE [Deltaproteobacteria bacterium SM23_61]
MAGRLGDLLVSNGLISPQQLEKALQDQKLSGTKLGSALVKLGYISEKNLVSFLSRHYGVPAIDLNEIQIDADAMKMIPADVIFKYQAIPIKRVGSTLRVAMSDPSNILAIDDIKFLAGCHVEVFVSTESAIKTAIERFYDPSSALNDIMSDMNEGETIDLLEDTEDIDVSELKQAVEDAPVVKLVNLILNEAINRTASDIHIEPYEKIFRVRLRVDGVLYEFMKPPMKLKNAITSRVKIMSRLDIAERRLPQDGRIKVKYGRDKEMDFRVSVLPTLFGEKVVMRLLDKSSLQLDMTKLGFEENPLLEFREAIHKPFGMVLVTGPTGSGKTTTLYSALTELNQISENISTAEDPVEYNLMGINQVQIHEEIGLSFANSLRSFLRQDPDIIMVGEIRDFETAEIAIKAALTGHLVLSTLHTNDAPSTISRLLNMGIEPFLVSSAVNLIVAQRLARKICESCKNVVQVSPQMLMNLGVSPEELPGFTCYKGAGCPRCNNTGYKGRVALYEVLPVREEIRELILQGASAGEIKKGAISLGMKTLRQAALQKLKEGVTTVDEVLKVTVED